MTLKKVNIKRKRNKENLDPAFTIPPENLFLVDENI